MGAQAHEDRVSRFLGEFVRIEKLPYYTRDSIRAVVISGEASAESIAALERVARKAVGTEPLEYGAEIGSSEIVAYGAAEYARITQRHPAVFTVERGTGAPSHDEL
jgi:hypothetical protein